MICNVCGNNKATIHVTEFIDGNLVELHICESCSHANKMHANAALSLNDIFSGLMQFTGPTAHVDKLLHTRCPHCKVSLKDVQRNGKVGCARCYESFATFFMPIIKKVHGSTQHFGKKPVGLDEKMSLQAEISALESDLQKHIKCEGFEEAALIRDKIKFLKGRLSQQEKPAKKKKASSSSTRKKTGTTRSKKNEK